MGAPRREESASGPAATSARMVLFFAGDERFALPLEEVREVVVPRPPFARVPRAPKMVRGAMNLRGRVVAVIELAPLLGLAADLLRPEEGHVIILDRERRGLGLLVKGIVGVQDLEVPREPESREPRGLVRGTAQLAGAAVTVLDAQAVEGLAASLFVR